MKKLAILMFAFFPLLTSVAAEHSLSLRVGIFGVPGIQYEYKINRIGFEIGYGINPLFFVTEDKTTVLNYSPFDICFNYYLLNTEDDILIFFDVGSGNYYGRVTGVSLDYISSNIVLFTGIGISTDLWKKIILQLKTGDGYAFENYREFGDLSLSPEIEPWAWLFE